MILRDTNVAAALRARQRMRSAPPSRQRGFLLNPFRFGASNDPFFANVVLLLHADGTSGSTTIVDSSSYARTPSASGVSLTNVPALGNCSISFSGSTVLRYADAAEFTLGTGDFTIELFARFSDTGTQRFLFGQGDSAGSNASASVAIQRTAGNAIRFVAISGSTPVADITGATAISSATWYYIAAKRSGTTFSLDVGTSGATILQGTATSAASLNNSANALAVGGLGEFASSLMWGNIDEVRFTVGAARSTATVPTATFPNA
jgi:hypothetical protein